MAADKIARQPASADDGTKLEMRWKSIYREYFDLVHSACRRYASSNEEIADLCQETFFQVLRSWESFSEQSKTSTWIYSVANNVSKQRLIRRNREKRLLNQYLESESARVNEEEHVHSNVDSRVVERILEGFDTQTKKILLLYSNGYRQNEIADHMGVSRVAITRRLTRLKTNMYRACKDTKWDPIPYHDQIEGDRVFQSRRIHSNIGERKASGEVSVQGKNSVACFRLFIDDFKKACYPISKGLEASRKGDISVQNASEKHRLNVAVA